MRRIPRLCLPALALALCACGHGKVTLGVSDSTFVATIVKLHGINADTMLDSVSRAAARSAVLKRQGVTVEELERVARAMASDPRHAMEVWLAIQQGVRAAGDTTSQ